MVGATPGIPQDIDPRDWRRHRFGLPADRWQSLSGKSVWITGAGTGYGRSIAVALAAAGVGVFLSGRRLENLRETIGEMEAAGCGSSFATPLPVDVTDPDAVMAAAAVVAGHAPDLHGLVHCAALPQPPAGPWPLTDMTAGQWQQVMATNVMAPWQVSRAALPALAAGKAARVVFLSSNAGWHFTPGVGAYNVSKSALNNLGASLAAEWAERYPGCDFQVNVIDPGEARTEMNQGSDISPYAVVPMVLLLLSHPPGGPNGRFFCRDGRHMAFGAAEPYDRPLS